MAINVVCPSCHKRFSVADEHAGKTGPCPACKGQITIPKLEDQVVIHAPKDGPTDSKGRPVLKTEKVKDGTFSLVTAGAVGGAVVVAFAAAFLLQGSELASNAILLGSGAVVLGPLLAGAGYGFLRDSELEPYTGGALAIRASACGLAFAAAWGAYALLAYQMSGSWPVGSLEIYQTFIAAAVAVGIGAFASYVSLDLDPAVGAVHFALFFVTTVLLRLTLGLTSLPGIGG
ncbi:MAG: hypothetical protein AAGJ46_07400 [Planctomycetota bacterium]